MLLVSFARTACALGEHVRVSVYLVDVTWRTVDESEDEFYIRLKPSLDQETISGLPDPVIRRLQRATTPIPLEESSTTRIKHFPRWESFIFDADMVEGTRYFLDMEGWEEDSPDGDDPRGVWPAWAINATGPTVENVSWPIHGSQWGLTTFDYTVHLRIVRDRQWIARGFVPTAPPVVGRHRDGRLNVFVRGVDHAIWHCRQTLPGSFDWTDWESLGGDITTSPVVGRNPDGRLELFAGGLDDALWHNYQLSPDSSSWSGWSSLGGSVRDHIAVCNNVSGRLEVFVRDDHYAIQHCSQTGSGSTAWSPWSRLWADLPDGFAVGRNLDGRLILAARGTDNVLYQRQQTTSRSLPWTDWVSLEKVVAGTPAILMNQDGRLDIFAWDATGVLAHRQQAGPNSSAWQRWQFIPAIRGADLDFRGADLHSGSVVVGNMNCDARLEIFTTSANEELFHCAQSAPNGQNWLPLSPFIFDRAWGPPAVGRNADGRLELFVRSNRGLYSRKQYLPAQW